MGESANMAMVSGLRGASRPWRGFGASTTNHAPLSGCRWPARVLERRTVTKEDGSKHEINIVLFFVDNTIGEVSGALLPFHEHYHRFKDFDYNNKVGARLA